MAVERDTGWEVTDLDELCYPSYGLREPWQEDRSIVPGTDDDTTALIDAAVDSLLIIRAPFEFGALPTISALVSLAGEIDSRLPDAVANARDWGYCWGAISWRLATTTATARRRYAGYARWRKGAR